MPRIPARACAILIACGLMGPVSPQPGYFFEPHDSGLYGIHDRHFRGVLFPEAYKSLPSVKVSYPGLWIAESNSAAVGLLPGQIARSGGDGWNALYAHADIDASPGSAGLWLGNFNLGRSFSVFDYHDITVSWDIREFSLRGAFWISPYQNEAFRGVSAAFGVDNYYAYNGNDFDGLFDNKNYYLNINALIKISDGCHLKLALHTYNKHADNPTDTRSDNRRLFADAFSAGLLDAKLRSLDLRVQNTFAMNNADEKRDTVSLSLRYAEGRAASYMKHTLFAGLKAEAGAAYPSKINADAGSFQYMHYIDKLASDGRVLYASAAAPVIADIGLFRGLRCMISLCPKISYAHIAPQSESEAEDELHLYPQSRFATELSEVELSLRGLAGDKLDFALMPSLKSDVFFSAMEVRYRF